MAIFSVFGSGQRRRPWPNLKALPPTLYQFVLRHTGAAQLRLALMSFVSFPLLYISLDLPKHSINVAVKEETAKTLFDVSFEAVPYLILVTLAYLILVLVNEGIKYAIFVYTGRLDAKAILVLRVSLRHAGRRIAGLTDGPRRLPVITKETDVIGAFAGSAIATPLFQGGTLITILIFFIVQKPLFGTLVVSLLSLHWAVVPRIQRHLNHRFSEYTLGIRDIADASISETEVTSPIRSQPAYYLLLRSNFHLQYRRIQLHALLK
jgi:putative ABC transport system ATP-binding protein